MLTAFTRAESLPFPVQALREEEITDVVDTLYSSWISPGPKTHRFQAAFADYLRAPRCLATLGIGPGDEAIITPLTFAASVSRRAQDLPSAEHATT